MDSQDSMSDPLPTVLSMSIHRQPNGTYKVRYRVGSKQFSKNGFTSRKTAEAFEQEQRRKLQNSSWTDPKAARISLNEVFNDWLSNKNASDRTKYDYTENWRTVIQPEWGQVLLSEVAPASLSRWISSASKIHSSARMNKVITIFSQVFDWAVADQRIPENPLKRARELSTGPLIRRTFGARSKVFLDHQQVQILAEHAGHYRLMILVMAYTGLRFGEVSALQGKHVELLRMRIRVERAFSDVGGTLKEVMPKSGKPREVPLPQLLQSELQRRISQLDDLNQLLFTTTTGSVIRYSRFLRDVFKPAASSAGLSGLTPHGLRHTYAALAVQAGANPKVLQMAMGHSDIRLTLDTYGGLFGDDLDTLAHRLDLAQAASTNTDSH